LKELVKNAMVAAGMIQLMMGLVLFIFYSSGFIVNKPQCRYNTINEVLY